MKLHRYPSGGSCGLMAVAILTGEPLHKIARRVLRIRARFPRDYRGYQCPKLKMDRDTDKTYLSELKRALKTKRIKLRAFRPFGGKIVRFAKEHPKGFFFLNFKRRAAIYKDGLIYDNSPCYESSPALYRWCNDILELFAAIVKK